MALIFLTDSTDFAKHKFSMLKSAFYFKIYLKTNRPLRSELSDIHS